MDQTWPFLHDLPIDDNGLAASGQLGEGTPQLSNPQAMVISSARDMKGHSGVFIHIP